MSEPKIDAATFSKRIAILQDKLGKNEFNNSELILVVVGSTDEENPYQKSTIFHNWLLGYEFPATLIAVTKEKTIFITSVAKAKYLQPLKSEHVLVWTRNKDPEHNKKLFEDFVALLSADSITKIGVLTKDKYQGKFINEWTPFWDKINADDKIEKNDIAVPFSRAIEAKDDNELKNIRLASKISSNFMEYFSNEMVTIVDEDLKMSNSKLSEKIENKIDDEKFINKLKKEKNLDIDIDQLDWCYTPIVQSGGSYDLRPSAQSDNKQLHGGVIIASLGIRYKSYCSNISRTFLIDPTKEVERNYDFLVQIQKFILSILTPGQVSKDIFSKVQEYIRAERPDLEKNFTKNIGWNIGLEFRDSTFVLNSKNERVIPDHSTFNLSVGFSNLANSETVKDEKLKNYALLISDTVKIENNEVTTLSDYTKTKSEISFYFKDENESIKKEIDDLNDGQDSKKLIKKESSAAQSQLNSKILKSKLRTESKSHDESEEQRQKKIQKELHEQRQREGLQRFSDTTAIDPNDRKVVFKKYESYVRESQIPSMVKDLRVHVDFKAQTILIPISGRPVPFHINSYKNGSKNEEGEYTYIRLNFHSPGAGGSLASKKEGEIPYEDDPTKEFLRSITLRSKDGERISQTFKDIQDLKKESVKRELERKTMADVVEQAKLIQAKPGRLRRLDNVFVRPSPDTKRVQGSLSIHENGLRYQSPLKQDSRIDILFSNIKHLFFQPSKEELIVIIHVHLKTPIIVGKKKVLDVQFYREASDISIDETGGNRRGHRRYGDEDELEQEQEERRRRAALDKEYRRFAELIADSSNGLIDLDIPFRELGFTGVPSRASTFLMPTRDCLVQLIDPPFLVVTLEEVEIVQLERVQFGLKNFDLVFVFKDFSKPVVHINTIPMEVLEDIKSWLTDVDIPFTESTINLNWSQIMKTLQADPKQFFLDGGWSFLIGDSDQEDESESDAESEFEASDLDPSDEDVDSEPSEEDNYSESGSDYSGSGSGSDDEDEGEDWDTLDKKAARADAKSSFD